MNHEFSFGNFVRKRRRELDLTQEELARRVGCAAITVRKIEADDLRASAQIAERMALALGISQTERAEFVRQARAVRPEMGEVIRTTPPPSMDEIGREDLTGRSIRGYALSERIGMGGFGSVYRAVQPNVEREVAIKIILPAFADHPDFIRRFEAEAQIVARLEHPHIVPLYDYWREPGVAYLVMRLLRGGNIQTLLDAGPLPIDKAERMLLQICSALHAAHRIGVIHRDLKPANVLLDEDANAYLADFGIAQDLRNPDLQIHGQSEWKIGPQADIHCLGVMLYQMLTGKLPFTGPTPFDQVREPVYVPLPSLSASLVGLPRSLDQVVQRATAANPSEWYADALDLLYDFRQAAGKIGSFQPIAPFFQEETDLDIPSPFKGLQAFGEADAEIFFGREALVQQLLARLSEGGDLNRFLAVIGPSGSGKSSVVRAGLIPALRRGGLPGSENWFIVDMLPGKEPFKELEASLLRVAVNPSDNLLFQLRDGNRGLLRAVNSLLPEDPSVELVLLIDQFEEIFSLLEDEAERALLLENLASAVMDERSRLRVIITLRADFTDKPLRYVDFGEMLNCRFEFILPLNADEIERAVGGPARHVGLRLEKGLVSTIIRETGNQSGTLPLLQYALSALFEKRQGHTLTNQAYREIGGVLGALGRSAEMIYLSLYSEAQSAARQLFLRMVTLGTGTEDTRRRVTQNEIFLLQGEQKAAYTQAIEAFGKARLLTFDRDPISRGATVEVAHEALLREWTRLRGWLDDSRSDIRMQRQLAAIAQEWQTAGCDVSFLLVGARLEQFKSWTAETTVQLTREEHAFLEASVQEFHRREKEERERQQRELENAQKLAKTEHMRAEEQAHSVRKLRRRAVYLAGAFFIAVIFAAAAILLGLQARTAGQSATSRELAAASLNNLGIDPERSILLALEAVSASRTIEAEDALHRAVQASRVRLLISAHEPGNPISVQFNPQGNQVVTGSEDNHVFIWDAAKGEMIRNLEGHSASFSPDGKRIATILPDGMVKVWDALNGKEMPLENRVDAGVSVAFAPDGSRLATITSGYLPRIWDAQTGDELVSFPGHTDYVGFVSFSPDGNQIITGSDDGTARVWDAGTGKEISRLFPHPDWVLSAAFRPDGKQVVTTSGNLAVVWDIAGARQILTLDGHKNDIFSVAYSPNGAWIATGSQDHTVIIWDAETGKTLFTLLGHSGSIFSIAFSPDGTRLASAADDGTLRIWDLTPRKEMFALPVTNGGSGKVAISPDRNRLAAALDQTNVHLVDLATGITQAIWIGSGESVRDLAFSPDGALLLIGTGSPELIVWDISKNEASQFETGHTGGITSVAFRWDGKRFSTGSDDYKIKVWDTSALYVHGRSNLEPLYTIHLPQVVHSVAFHPDGSQLAAAVGDGTARLWDAATGLEKAVFHGHTSEVQSVAFNPDGNWLATAGNDGVAYVYNVATGKEVLALRGHTNTVVAIAFSPDGKRIATASRDGSTKLWDSATGEEILTFSGDGSGLGDIAFDPGGAFLAIGGDSSVQGNLLRIDDLVASAKTRVTRSLNQEECQKYLHRIAPACSVPKTAPTLTPMPPAKYGRICQVTNVGGLFDLSFNQQAYQGVLEVVKTYSWEAAVLESNTIPDIEKNLSALLDDNCTMIMTLGFIAGDGVRSAAEARPDQKFLLIDHAYDQPIKNVWTQVYATDQAAFLAGYAAAAATQTGKVGVFGGIDIPPVTDYMDGFALGVLYFNDKNQENIKVFGWNPETHQGLFTGGFCCSTEGRQLTEQLLNEGVDIIFPVAGTSIGWGAGAAVQARGNAYIIGVDTDWTKTFPQFTEIIFTSVEKRFDVTVRQVASAITDDTFTSDLHVGTLATGEVDLAPFYQFEDILPPKIKADLEQIQRDIIAGKIRTKP